ncbi:hypothetical protein SADUNF_Sadunf08G0067900 [Salix dunnii]|uniref:Uncharacterized protein n=1 Tax=Salix dunnii TaxID=1413687 RepID=A0A835JYV6_9ROSI|nr:hypothetical protein SADUNF_Sadunf08G0067900 [Salix dunnii]
MVEAELWHHVGVNYLFATWISWLLLLQSAFIVPKIPSYAKASFLLVHCRAKHGKLGLGICRPNLFKRSTRRYLLSLRGRTADALTSLLSGIAILASLSLSALTVFNSKMLLHGNDPISRTLLNQLQITSA